MSLEPRPGAAARYVFLPLMAVSVSFPAIAQEKPGTTVQLPTFGVSIDAEGVLALSAFPDAGELRAKRVARARANVPADVWAPSELRKVSLVRLDQEIARLLDAGRPPDELMLNLAGLNRLEYVFYYPDQADIVIAGPAGGFVADAAGRVVDVRTGRPVLQLLDLVVALRAYAPGSDERPLIGCTISPAPEGLARLRNFQQSIPGRIAQRNRRQAARQIARGMRNSLGMAQVEVFGISSRTRFAQVLLECDYRMKLIGIGLEPPPVPMTTFIQALSVPRHRVLQRWWFTPDYDCVKVTEDQLAMELVGQGVLLRGEEYDIDDNGDLAPVPRLSKPVELYSSSFTRKYPRIADRLPVYAQMRNLIDMLVACAFIRQQDFYGQSGCPLPTLNDEARLPTETQPAPKKVDSVVNAVWNGNRLVAPAGGVSIQADRALDPQRWLRDQDGRLRSRYATAAEKGDRWWWD